MSHIYYGISLDTISMMTGNKVLKLVYAIHHKALFLESLLHIRSRTHKTGEHDGRSAFFIQTILCQEGIIFAYAVEAEFIALFVFRVEMSKQIVWSFVNTLRLWSHKLLSVDKLADVSKHTVIVLLATVLDVLHQIIGIEVIYRYDIVGWVGSSMSQGRHLVGSLFQQLTLVLINTETHTIHDNHIVIVQMVEIIGSNLTKLNHSIVVGMRNLSQRNSLIVEESNASGTHPSCVSLRQTSKSNHC